MVVSRTKRLALRVKNEVLVRLLSHRHRRRNEIGEMTRAVEVFKRSMIEAERLAAQQSAARAARSRRQDVMEQLTETFGTSVSAVMATLVNSATGMRRAAEAMAQASDTVKTLRNRPGISRRSPPQSSS